MSVNLTYDDLWSYYKQADKEVQRDILKQLDLENYLPRVSVQVRSEVMRMAPRKIQERVQRIAPLSSVVTDYKKQLLLMFGGKRK